MFLQCKLDWLSQCLYIGMVPQIGLVISMFVYWYGAVNWVGYFQCLYIGMVPPIGLVISMFVYWYGAANCSLNLLSFEIYTCADMCSNVNI